MRSIECGRRPMPPAPSAWSRSLVQQPDTKFIGGSTNLIDLMKGDVEQPVRLVDINHNRPGWNHGTARRRTAHRRRRPQRRYRPPPTGAHALSALERSAAVRRFAPAAQHGDRWRQPAAAQALPLVHGYRFRHV